MIGFALASCVLAAAVVLAAFAARARMRNLRRLEKAADLCKAYIEACELVFDQMSAEIAELKETLEEKREALERQQHGGAGSGVLLEVQDGQAERPRRLFLPHPAPRDR